MTLDDMKKIANKIGIVKIYGDGEKLKNYISQHETLISVLTGEWLDGPWYTPPDIKSEISYVGCIDFEYIFSINTLVITLWNGDNVYGNPTTPRCKWSIVIDNSHKNIIEKYLVPELKKRVTFAALDDYSKFLKEKENAWVAERVAQIFEL